MTTDARLHPSIMYCYKFLLRGRGEECHAFLQPSQIKGMIPPTFTVGTNEFIRLTDRDGWGVVERGVEDPKATTLAGQPG